MLARFLMRASVPAILIVALTSTRANATLTVTVYINNNQVAQYTDTNDMTAGTGSTGVNLSFGGTTFNNITINATANTPGDPLAQQGSLAQVSVTTTSSTGGGTLKVVVVEDKPYTIPAPYNNMQQLQSNVARSDGKSNTLTFQSFVYADSAQTSLLVDGGLQTQDQNVLPMQSPNQILKTFTNPGTSYTLKNVLTVTTATGSLNVNGTTYVNAVPEPGTLALAVAGLPLIGFGFWSRRRRT